MVCKSDTEFGVIIVKWFDNNAVHIASNYVGVKPMGIVERWSQKDQKKKNIQCPQLVLQYNKGMGGVDLADMLISLYRMKIKTRRWYIKIFWHLVDMAKVNAWLLYCGHCDQLGIPEKQRLSSLDFALEIAECLITANKEVPMETFTGKPGSPSKRKSGNGEGSSNEGSSAKVGCKPTTPLPSKDPQYDQVGHWPKPTNDHSRCRFCKNGFSKIFCSKCNICLCLREGKTVFWTII